MRVEVMAVICMVHLSVGLVWRVMLFIAASFLLCSMAAEAAPWPVPTPAKKTMPAGITNKYVRSVPAEQSDGSTLPAADIIWPFLDHYYDVISQKVQDNTLRVDSFFDDDLPDNDVPSCTVKLRLSNRFKYEDGFSISPGAGVNAQINLPHLEKKWHVFVDNIQRDHLPGEDFPFSDKLSAGLRWNPFSKYPSLLHIDGGIRSLDPWPEPFAILEMRYDLSLGLGWTAYLKQQGFCYVGDDGFGELSQVDFEQMWVGNARFRSTTAVKWTQESQGVEGEQTLSWEITLEPHVRSITPCLSLFWYKESALVADDYRIKVTYRTRIYRTWLFFEVEPQFEFPQDNNYDFTPSIRFNVDIFFNGPSFD